MKKLFLFLTFLFAAFAANAQNTYLKGDMNDDGILDVTDIMIIVNKILSGENTSVEQQSYLTCPDDNHPHLIDLGLPSGTKWACCNVDTDHPENQSPTNYGGYYAWGETEEKGVYNEINYQYCTGVDKDGDGWFSYPDDYQYQSLGSDIAGTQYDVAHVKWGGSWVMPSYDQIMELGDNCTYTWTTMNGVKGGLFTGESGGTIFLPGAGMRHDIDLSGTGWWGWYRSSTQDPSFLENTFIIQFHPNGADSKDGTGLRCDGHTVRPVSR